MIDIAVIQEKIEKEYVDGGYSQGWKFLYSSKKTLWEANTAFLGLNPGGSDNYPSKFSQECGSSYETEKWKQHKKGQAPLQLQVKVLFKILDIEPKNVLASNLIPFRAPNWKDVDRAREIQFADNLWSPILFSRPFRIVFMGFDAKQFFVKRLGELGAKHDKDICTGWMGRYGEVKASFYRYKGGHICYLPHLSRFGIFKREKTEELEKALRDMRV